MIINFMSNNSPDNQISKSIVSVKQMDCELKHQCSIQTPVLIVSGLDITKVNYCYIPDWNRYYYITDIITHNSDISEIHLKVDVLMSHATAIRSSSGVVLRNANIWNGYYQDNLPIEAYNRIITKLFPKGFENYTECVLTVCGGRSSE